MRRAGLVAALGVGVLLMLGLAGMHDDVEEEMAGARTVATLAERLAVLPAMSDEQARLALAAWHRDGVLRHLHVRVTDAAGGVVLADSPGRSPVWWSRWLAGLADSTAFAADPPFSMSWALARPQGGAWAVSLTAAPESERREAMHSLLGSVALLALVAAGMLAVMHWNTRQAFQPLSRLLDAIGGLESADGASNSVRNLPAMPIAELETIAGALRHLDAALEAAQRQRRRLARQVLSLQEDERGRLARELHDEFGQQLTALRVNASWLNRRTADQPELQAVVRDMEGQCASIQQDIRAVLNRLRPLPGPAQNLGEDDGGESLDQLRTLLEGLVRGWQGSPGQGAAVQLRVVAGTTHDNTQDAVWPVGLRLPRECVLAVYRISQEALTNVARHAQATEARLQLVVTPPARAGDPVRLDWSVADDGIGLPDTAAALQRGNGLAGLKERVWALGADLQVVPSQPGTPRPGCRLSATLWVAPIG